MRIKMLAAVLTLCLPAQAWAQSVPAVQDFVEETETSTTEDAESAKGDERTKAVTVPPDEYQPPRPPTAAEIEEADTPAKKQALAARELERFAGTAESFGRDIKDVIRVRYNAQRERIAAGFDRQIEELEGGAVFVKVQFDAPRRNPPAKINLDEPVRAVCLRVGRPSGGGVAVHDPGCCEWVGAHVVDATAEIHGVGNCVNVLAEAYRLDASARVQLH